MSDPDEYAVLEYRLADKSIVPLVDLSSYNNKSNAIGASSDLEAISVWLSRYVNENTIKSYYKDVNRFIYWLAFIGGKSLNNLTVSDLNKYVAFLKNPPQNWCMPDKKYKRYHLEWRPFNGPLQKNALNYALIVLNSLFTFLENASYIKKNPVKLLQKKNMLAQYEEQKIKIWERTLDDNEWQTVVNVLSNLPENTERLKLQKIKTQMLFACLYILGLRIHEAANAKYSNLKSINGTWWFVLHGKGDKLGTIPVNSQFLQILQEYRLVQNLSPEFYNDENYLFNNNRNTITIRTLYNMVKNVGKIASEKFENEYSKEKLLNLSPHWLRHMSATHQSRLGTPIEIIKDNHRHSSMQTTEIYMHSDRDLRQQFMQKHILDIDVGLKKDIQQQIVINASKIIIKFLKSNPPMQLVNTISEFVNKQLLANLEIVESKFENNQQLVILVLEKNLEVNFKSLNIISKVWGVELEANIEGCGVI